MSLRKDCVWEIYSDDVYALIKPKCFPDVYISEPGRKLFLWLGEYKLHTKQTNKDMETMVKNYLGEFWPYHLLGDARYLLTFLATADTFKLYVLQPTSKTAYSKIHVRLLWTQYNVSTVLSRLSVFEKCLKAFRYNGDITNLLMCTTFSDDVRKPLFQVKKVNDTTNEAVLILREPPSSVTILLM